MATGKFITCYKCGQHGGTLRRMESGKYQHEQCPEPIRRKPRIVTPKSNLVIANPQDVLRLRRPLPKK